MQIDNRFVLGNHDDVKKSVVVEVTASQPSAQVRRPEWLSGKGRHIAQSAPIGSDKELDPHFPGKHWPIIAHVSVGGHQVEATVVIRIKERNPEAQQESTGAAKPIAAVLSTNCPWPRLW